jgi:hypothetical protein
MTPAYKLQEIQQLAAKLTGDSDQITVSVAAASKAKVTDETINRVLGAPFGITDATWPRAKSVREMFGQDYRQQSKEFDGDYRMDHVFTLDVRGLKHLGLSPKIAAVAVFMSNRSYNEAWKQGTDHAAVVLLGEEALANGPYKGALPRGASAEQAQTFDLVHIKLPRAVFTTKEYESDAGQLRDALFESAAYFGGAPIWLQDDPDEDEGGYDEDYGDDEGGYGDEDEADEVEDTSAWAYTLTGLTHNGFIGQCGEEFGDMNLGDSGKLYIYGHDAFWQCY